MRVKTVSAVFLTLALLVVRVAHAQTAASPVQTKWPVVSFNPSDCQTCHADQMTEFQRTHHAKLSNNCSQCHGDVATHARMMMNGEGKGPVISIKSMDAQDTNNVCLSCHDRRRQANFKGGVHERKGLACTTCHSVHAFKSDRAQLKSVGVSDTCFSCHQNMRAQSMRASHHPVREGKMDCGSCHDPHDSTQPKMIRATSVNELCYTCHTEKRGPFLWEHAPVRENCINCHNAHGSNHEKLLVAKMPYLCQRCHLSTRHPGTLYDLRNTVAGANLSNRAVEHACRNCHQNVHGSNAPSGPYLGR